MFIFTAKLSKEKIIISVLILAALICLICVLVANAGDSGSDQPATAAISFKNISSNEDRIALLESYGWTVSADPIETVEVKIPEEAGEVFTAYNELQMSQGFDLNDYAGKNVKKYTYEVTNHPASDDNVVVSLLVYKKKVIGGDVSGLESPGFMHGLDFPTSRATEVSQPEGPSVTDAELKGTEEAADPAADASASVAAMAVEVVPEVPDGVKVEKDEETTAESVMTAEEDIAVDAAADEAGAQTSVGAEGGEAAFDNLPVSVSSSDSIAASSIVPEVSVNY